ncbi:helix-turn-helix domain-containing protein [Galbibacter sp. BG1]
MKKQLNMEKLNDADRLKKVMHFLNISGVDLAMELEVSKSTIYQITQGKNNISDMMAEKIVEKFPSISYSFLKRGIGNVSLNFNDSQNQKNLLHSGASKYIDLNIFLEVPERLKNIEKLLTELNKKIDSLEKK